LVSGKKKYTPVHKSQIIVSATAGLNRKHGRLTRQYQEKVGACEDQKVPPPNGREGGRRDFGYHETMQGQWIKRGVMSFLRTYLNNHALPVLIAVIGTLTMSGLISLA
jgi:hypothetical protein